MYDKNEWDEFPEKPCPECGTVGERDVICRECEWTVCMACFDPEEWVPVTFKEDDLCHECNKTKPRDNKRGC